MAPQPGYAPDATRQQFTGYERDLETGLDYARARHFTSSQGRFTSPDPLGASMRAGDPQSLNRYSYTGNDPVNRTDSSGLDWTTDAAQWGGGSTHYRNNIGEFNRALGGRADDEFDWSPVDPIHTTPPAESEEPEREVTEEVTVAVFDAAEEIEEPQQPEEERGGKFMHYQKILWASLSLLILLLGLLQPQLVLLDMPFGLAVYVADKFGYWEPGLMWAPNHRLLAVICFIAWPILVSTLLGYFVSLITLKLWSGGTKNSRLSASIFIIVVFGLLLVTRVTPGSYFVSYWGYATANY